MQNTGRNIHKNSKELNTIFPRTPLSSECYDEHDILQNHRFLLPIRQTVLLDHNFFRQSVPSCVLSYRHWHDLFFRLLFRRLQLVCHQFLLLMLQIHKRNYSSFHSLLESIFKAVALCHPFLDKLGYFNA